ncbi:unnamed protein product [Alternaria alternata]|jgi:serine/threonine protein kinase
MNVIKELAKEVDRACCENSEGHRFLPYNRISDFASEKAIRSVFGATKCFRSMRDLIKFIQDDASRLFLILVLMESDALEQRLHDFREEGFVDNVLPIKLIQDVSAKTLRIQDPPDNRTYRVFRNWERTKKDLFVDIYQWRFTAPVFGTTRFHQELPVGQWLPFLEVAPQPASSGYFGEVTRTVIHAKHIDPSTELPTFMWTSKELDQYDKPLQINAIAIAVKKAKEGEDDPNYNRAAFFDKEVKSLTLLREHLQRYRSKNIIKPISGYKIGHCRCLIFAWADGGNLGGYWEKHPTRARERDDILWQLRQFEGICSALKELHGNNIRHGDLKPENILWFDSENKKGTLQIADLGLATFHEKEASTKNRQGMPTQTPSGTSRYEPPEMDDQRNKSDPRSRQYDIWSFGCVVFELLLWLAYGPNGIKIFRRYTPYFWQKVFERGSNRYMIHDYVEATMEALDSEFKTGTAHKDLLNLVRSRLLVVKVAANYDDVSDDCRESATKVHECFQKIIHGCEHQISYLEPLKDELQYPEAALNEKAPQRDDPQRNEFEERNGRLAVPGQKDATKPALSSSYEQMEDSSLESSQQGPDIPVLRVRHPTFDLADNNLSRQTSQASNHHEVC